MQLSYWEWKTYFKQIDVAIVGSGIVGLSAALHLKKNNTNLNVVVFERGALPAGASTKNAGFACLGSTTELLDDLENNTETAVFELVEMRWRGLTKLKETIGANNLKYKNYGSYELFTAKDAQAYQKSIEQLSYLNKNIENVIGLKNTFSICKDAIDKFGFNKVNYLLQNKYEGQIDTGAMMQQLIKICLQKDVKIVNGLNIKTYNTNNNTVTLTTQNGWVFSAKKLIIATNGFTKNLLPNVKVNPARNQVLITKPIKSLKIKGCFHYNKGYVYFRNIDDRILLGGGRNLFVEQETTNEFGLTENVKNYLIQLLKEVILPNQKIEIEKWWSGILGVHQTKKPIVKEIENNVILAVRLGGMGIAIGSLIGEQAANLST